jgi:hypothetical protein
MTLLRFPQEQKTNFWKKIFKKNKKKILGFKFNFKNKLDFQHGPKILNKKMKKMF